MNVDETDEWLFSIIQVHKFRTFYLLSVHLANCVHRIIAELCVADVLHGVIHCEGINGSARTLKRPDRVAIKIL